MVAEMSTRRIDKRRETNVRPWQRRHTHDRGMFVMAVVIFLGAGTLWTVFETNKDELSQDERSVTGSPNNSSDVGDLSPRSGDNEPPTIHPSKEAETDRSHLEPDNDDSESLVWWIEAAPLPHPLSLRDCLTRKDQAPPTLLAQEGGFSVLISGRQRPQTIFEQREKIWVKTPLLASPHQQAYDHLVLISCLQSPGATLHDPRLVRQWGGENWPQRSSERSSVSLEDLFLIRSQGDQHYTFGLDRLGLPDLGIITKSEEARTWLRQLTLYWLMKPQSRTLLSDKVTAFTLNDQKAKMVIGESIKTWLGPVKVRVIADEVSSLFTEDQLSKIFSLSSKVTPTEVKNSKKKSKQVKRSRGKVRQKVKSKAKSQPPAKELPTNTLPKLKYR